VFNRRRTGSGADSGCRVRRTFHRFPRRKRTHYLKPANTPS